MEQLINNCQQPEISYQSISEYIPPSLKKMAGDTFEFDIFESVERNPNISINVFGGLFKKKILTNYESNYTSGEKLDKIEDYEENIVLDRYFKQPLDPRLEGNCRGKEKSHKIENNEHSIDRAIIQENKQLVSDSYISFQSSPYKRRQRSTSLLKSLKECVKSVEKIPKKNHKDLNVKKHYKAMYKRSLAEVRSRESNSKILNHRRSMDNIWSIQEKENTTNWRRSSLGKPSKTERSPEFTRISQKTSFLATSSHNHYQSELSSRGLVKSSRLDRVKKYPRLGMDSKKSLLSNRGGLSARYESNNN